MHWKQHSSERVPWRKGGWHDYMWVKWPHASSKHAGGGVSHRLVFSGPGGRATLGHHARHTEMERQMNYNWCFMADTASSVRTQKEPLRDSDLLVLTVCCYRQKIKRGEKKKNRERRGKKKRAWFSSVLSAKPEVTRDVSDSLITEFVQLSLVSLPLKRPWKHMFSISFLLRVMWSHIETVLVISDERFLYLWFCLLNGSKRAGQ